MAYETANPVIATGAWTTGRPKPSSGARLLSAAEAVPAVIRLRAAASAVCTCTNGSSLLSVQNLGAHCALTSPNSTEP